VSGDVSWLSTDSEQVRGRRRRLAKNVVDNNDDDDQTTSVTSTHRHVTGTASPSSGYEIHSIMYTGTLPVGGATRAGCSSDRTAVTAGRRLCVHIRVRLWQFQVHSESFVETVQPASLFDVVADRVPCI